ncbi:hypothetical protein AMELA_G00260980 [Ameiurus melas]|uniref:Uncharacterized protein n=1 Tax=Ameiurus melas TaxID=219545 RepID=A0A7J5ZNW0_AMEME|nr:hypothetical protein AMELA_G00260980 [Ameiurus melas]
MFAVYETPQASTSFILFKLLLGRRPQRLLDMAKEDWEKQPSPFCSMIKNGQSMQDWIDRVVPIRKQHMEEAQAQHTLIYN